MLRAPRSSAQAEQPPLRHDAQADGDISQLAPPPEPMAPQSSTRRTGSRDGGRDGVEAVETEAEGGGSGGPQPLLGYVRRGSLVLPPDVSGAAASPPPSSRQGLRGVLLRYPDQPLPPSARGQRGGGPTPGDVEDLIRAMRDSRDGGA